MQGGGPGDGHGHADDRIGAQSGLVVCPVQVDQHTIQIGLIFHLAALQSARYLGADVLDRLSHATAAIPGRIAIAKFVRLEGA